MELIMREREASRSAIVILGSHVILCALVGYRAFYETSTEMSETENEMIPVLMVLVPDMSILFATLGNAVGIGLRNRDRKGRIQNPVGGRIAESWFSRALLQASSRNVLLGLFGPTCQGPYTQQNFRVWNQKK